MDEQPPRTAINAPGQQAGDQTFGNTAGGNIYAGADPELLAEMLGEAMGIIRAYFVDDQKREIRQLETDRWRARITVVLLLVAGVLGLQTIILAITLAALVSLLWPRLSALAGGA